MINSPHRDLGLLLQAQGDLPAARQHLERALRIFEPKLPPGHPNIEAVRRGLAQVNAGEIPRPTLNQLRFFLANLPGARKTQQ